MYSVLIIDDEPWILSWIEKIFKWNEKGFKVIASTDDPEEAYEIIFRDEPDVVFTDIRMPEISGLDLMRITRDRGMDTEFVVISGFAEFSYAQQAIREGAFDYRLKPIQMDEADELLDRLYKHLEEKRSKKNVDILEALMIDEQEDFGSLLKIRGLSGTFKYYQAVSVVSEIREDSRRPVFSQGSQEVLEFRLGPKKQLYLVNCSEDCEKGVTSFFSNEYGDAECFIGISSLKENESDIPRLIKEADMAANSRFIYERCGVYAHKRGNHTLLKSTIENIFASIDAGSWEKLKNALEKVHTLFIFNEMGMDDVVYFWNQIVAHVTGTSRNKALSFEFEFMNYNQIVDKFRTLDSMCEYLYRFLCRLKNSEDTSMESRETNENFERLLEYVNENFTQKLYLKELSSKFYINFTYCCELFKKSTGTTFSDYVTSLRMKKSRELLENKKLSIDRICEEAGYSDYYYFNSLFKKYHGITPSQYRKAGR